jgi:hypothetical protein
MAVPRFRRRQGSRRAAGAAIVISLVAALAVAAFTWPMARLEPRDLPLGLVGSDYRTAAIERDLAEGGAFDLRRYGDEAAARTAIEEREIYGALVVSAEGSRLLTASAAGPTVAQVLRQELASAAPSPPAVIDVVPADPDDPRGTAFSSLLLPLTLVGILTGLIVGVVTRPGVAQTGVLVAVALLVGAVAVTLVQGWLGVIGGDWWANVGVLALLVLAIASLVVGLRALLGFGGFALAALLLVFVGNPFSGVSTSPTLLPEWASMLGQLLPPGAGGSLLRSSAFFDGNGGEGPLAVLVVWIALGLAAVWAGALRSRGAGAPRGLSAAVVGTPLRPDAAAASRPPRPG